MAVPEDKTDNCLLVETDLRICEQALMVAQNAADPGCIPPAHGVDFSSDPAYLPAPAWLISCGLVLGVLVSLHIARQAWYAWGGEGAFAFPFDK
jgi:hypothetical protein